MSTTPSDVTPTRHDFHRRIEEVKPSKTDINHLVMGYLISEGYPEAAKKFAAEANIPQPQGETDNIQERVEIRNAILAGDIETAIERINDLTPELLDRDTKLHFSLLRLQLTEMIRKCTASPDGDITPAIAFAQSQLAPIAPSDTAFLADLEKTMALLIFPPENLTAPLSGLLDPELRQTIASNVNAAVLKELEYDGEAKIKGLIKLRAWAERKAREKKLSLPAEGLDLWARKHSQGHERDGEDSVMND